MKISELMQQHHLSNVKAVDESGNTILHLVVKNEKLLANETVEIFQKLLRNGVDQNIKNNDNETVLHLAMEIRAKDIVDFILKIKRTHDSINFKHSVITCLLETERNRMSKLVDKSEISESEMRKFESESASFVEWILSRNIKMDRYGDWTLSMAIQFGLQHILTILLKHTVEINKESEILHQFLRQTKVQRDEHQAKTSSFWYLSYSRRHTKRFVRDLLEKGISPEDCDKNENTILHLAIESKESIDIIEMLIDQSMKGNRKNDNVQTAFYIVIAKWLYEKSNTNYYRKIVNTLVAKGLFDIKESDDHENSLMNSTVRERNLWLVDFLNQCGSNFNTIKENGDTLVHLLVKSKRTGSAVFEIDTQLLDLLISKGCNINAKNKNGLTALHIVAETGITAIAQNLIEHKAHVNCRDNQGWTPLHYAATYNQLRVAELLLKFGANVDATDSRNHTPLHLAIANGQIHNDNRMIPMLELLLKYGADPNEEFPNLSLTVKYEERFIRNQNLEVHPGFYLLVHVPTAVKEQELFFKHWMKLKALNLDCAANNEYQRHYDSMGYRESSQICLDEIETLKINFIDGPVSLYTFLHMSPKNRCAYINNEKLKHLIGKQVTLEKNFPEYSILILAKYREAVTRKPLLRLANETWLELTKIVLPDLCLECIFSFLSNSDLFGFVEGE